ncbi:hypothetical protein G6F35_015650 [Rhizopus arrhizus]|nr:hypothetical protein G6F35_015650 [Rhizopus arrhizus]
MNIAVINVVAATANVPTQPLPCPANRALGRAATSRAANAIITATTRAVSHGAACANTTRKIWPTSSNCTTVRTAAHNTCRCRRDHQIQRVQLDHVHNGSSLPASIRQRRRARRCACSGLCVTIRIAAPPSR